MKYTHTSIIDIYCTMSRLASTVQISFAAFQGYLTTDMENLRKNKYPKVIIRDEYLEANRIVLLTRDSGNRE
jgi:hypothetical protein